MRPTVKIIQNEGFRRMAAELSQISGRDYADVIKNRGASVLKRATLWQGTASQKQITESVTQKVHTASKRFGSGVWSGDEWRTTENVRKNIGRAWVWLASDPRGMGRKHSQLFYMPAGTDNEGRRHHVPDIVFGRYLQLTNERETFRKKMIAELNKRRGLERLSWLQMGDAMGVPLSTVGPQGNLNETLARGAAANGRTYQNGSSQESTSGARYVCTVTNVSPIASKRQGQNRLARSINAGVSADRIALAKGMGRDLKRRSARWPGIFVTVN